MPTTTPQSASKPDPALVQRAIDVYVKVAYPDGPPLAVQSMLATERTWAGHLTDAPVFVKDDQKNTTKWSMRLGNTTYPHMKLIVERAPDGNGHLFRADAHDAHCCPPQGTPEHAAFRELMTRNQEVVSKIEKAWGEAGVPTMKTYLQADLAKRKSM